MIALAAALFILIFAGLFYTPAIVSACAIPVFIVLVGLAKRSALYPLKRTGFAALYFLPIFIFQALARRGEVITLLGVELDRFGVMFTLRYYLRITAFVLFLTLFTHFVRKIPLPNNRLGDEAFRMFFFFRLLRKYFFRELRALRMRKGLRVKDAPRILAALLNACYIRAFRLYPYRRISAALGAGRRRG